MEFGKIQLVALREIWTGEATHFTPWLAQNLSVISEKLGMDLDLETVEGNAGDFSADIVARDLSTGRLVVIENQFGKTDHKHLGQIITYSSVLGAGVVVWIAEAIRAEHKSAIDFLNQNLKAGLQLFAIEVSVIRIDDSKPAYVFNTICAPSEAQVSVTDGVKGDSDTGQKYRTYFQGLIDELRTVHKFTNAKAGQPQNWYDFSSENSKIYRYSTSFAQGGRVRAEVYIDCGDKIKNEALFDLLYSQRDGIQAEFGIGELKWERLDAKRSCRIAVYRDGDIDVDTGVLAEIRKWAIENLLRLKATFPKRFTAALATVNVQAQTNFNEDTSPPLLVQ
ncbi:DUF4268 domain-containing protein [Massilia sp. RP-1-19]|uniref:DUF4268 domain-containing protein n=1 Tax=Massilia polaris TaxID=2728846 RepID=A0A848HVL7_9BURK|nr:DUF4268 domain-containing protein [Massilia polaris]NML62788.1 DUF4268 domain-containing protein [Massilia polaris]